MTERRDPGQLLHWVYRTIDEKFPGFTWVDDPSELRNIIQSGSTAYHHSVSRRISTSFIQDLAQPILTQIRAKYSPEDIDAHRIAYWEPKRIRFESGILNATIQEFRLERSHALPHPSCSDMAWRDFILSFELELPPAHQEFFELLDDAPLFAFAGADAVYCLPWPESHFNHLGRLHHPDAPAVQFGSDTIYAWNGVRVPENYITETQCIDREAFTRERNAERRRALFEILGPRRYSDIMDLEIVQQSIDRKGNLQSLYRTREPDAITKDRLYFAEVTCPSTNRVYYLSVPPYLKTAQEAVAWTFSLDEGTYTPDEET